MDVPQNFIVLFALDALHRTRFNEIFHRWHHMADDVVPRIRLLIGDEFLQNFFKTGVDQLKEFKFIEKTISDRGEDYYRKSEGIVLFTVTGLSLLLTIPITGAYFANKLPLKKEFAPWIAFGWGVFLLLVYCLLFKTRKGYRKTYFPPMGIPALILVILVAMFLFGESIISLYQEILGCSTEDPVTP